MWIDKTKMKMGTRKVEGSETQTVKNGEMKRTREVGALLRSKARRCHPLLPVFVQEAGKRQVAPATTALSAEEAKAKELRRHRDPLSRRIP